MTNEEIIDITQRKGYFHVSWRYRDYGLRDQCEQLCYHGVLRRDWRGPGSWYYIIGPYDMIERYIRNRSQREARKKKEQRARQDAREQGTVVSRIVFPPNLNIQDGDVVEISGDKITVLRTYYGKTYSNDAHLPSPRDQGYGATARQEFRESSQIKASGM